MNLEQKLEAILFFKGEPLSIKRLIEILKVSKEDLLEAILSLNNNLQNRGLVLLQKEDELTLGTSPEFSELIEKLQKEELNKDLSKASLETLSIVLYKNGISRAEIDYIRGVNSSFTLRILSIRGLITKELDKKDSRRYIYKPSFDLLSYLGIKNLEELTDFSEINKILHKTIEQIEKLAEPEENFEEKKDEII
jgi:segregation and condensation protein B